MTRLVAELTGAGLALWVARAAGIEHVMRGEWPAIVEQWDPEAPASEHVGHPEYANYIHFRPHEEWSQGGPIIERANISLHPPTSPVHRCGGPNAGAGQSGVWSACTWTHGANGKRAFGMDDRSPLVAAMRCYVRYVYGDAVSDEVTP